MSRLLAAAIAVILSVAVVAACGPEEDGGSDLSRFAAVSPGGPVSPAAPPAAGR